MKSDFDLIVHHLPERKEIKLFFVADLHVGSIECNLKEWEQFCQLVLSDPTCYLAILGDMMDNGTKSSVTNCFDASPILSRPREQKKYLMNALKPLVPRILSLNSGNHEQRSANRDADDDPLYDVACKLDIEDLYRQNVCFVKVSIGERTNGKNRRRKPLQSYVYCTAHGSGGGGLTGSGVNRAERFATGVLEGVDIFASAHVHRGVITKPSKVVVDPTHNIITQKTITVVSACSWLSYGGYALNKMLSPHSAQNPELPQTVILGGQRDKRYIKTVW